MTDHAREQFEAWDQSGGYSDWKNFDGLSRHEQFFLCWQAAKATCPAWHDAPTVPGLWLRQSKSKASWIDVFDVFGVPHDSQHSRWYGPIPEDKP